MTYLNTIIDELALFGVRWKPNVCQFEVLAALARKCLRVIDSLEFIVQDSELNIEYPAAVDEATHIMAAAVCFPDKFPLAYEVDTCTWEEAVDEIVNYHEHLKRWEEYNVYPAMRLVGRGEEYAAQFDELGRIVRIRHLTRLAWSEFIMQHAYRRIELGSSYLEYLESSFDFAIEICIYRSRGLAELLSETWIEFPAIRQSVLQEWRCDWPVTADCVASVSANLKVDTVKLRQLIATIEAAPLFSSQLVSGEAPLSNSAVQNSQVAATVPSSSPKEESVVLDEPLMGLDENEYSVLEFLAKEFPRKRTQTQIRHNTSRSDKTIGLILHRLHGLKLVAYPKGARGAVITDFGKRHVKPRRNITG